MNDQPVRTMSRRSPHEVSHSPDDHLRRIVAVRDGRSGPSTIKDSRQLQQMTRAPTGSNDHLVRTAYLPDATSDPIMTMNHLQPTNLKYANTSHGRRVDAFTDWIIRRIDELVAETRDLPLVIPLTVTFAPMSTRPDQVLREYGRFYARLCDLLISNHDRPSKRRLLPFALAFRDDPSTRPDKYRRRPTAHDVFFNHPSVAPHVHSLIVVHPSLADRFLSIVNELQTTWGRIPVRTAERINAPTYANRTLYVDVPFALEIRELMRADPVGDRALVRTRIRGVVDYSAKLGRRHRARCDDDLFIVLPPSGRSRASAMSALHRLADVSRTS
jgi:hypothetical protein